MEEVLVLNKVKIEGNVSVTSLPTEPLVTKITDPDGEILELHYLDLVYNIDDLPFGKPVLLTVSFPMYLEEKTGRLITLSNNYITGSLSNVSPMFTLGPVHPVHRWTWQIKPSGDVTSYKVQFLGSLDASDWFVLDEYEGNDATPVMRHVVNKPVLYVGFRLVHLDGSSISVKLMSSVI